MSESFTFNINPLTPEEEVQKWEILNVAISDLATSGVRNLSYEELYRISYDLVVRGSGEFLYEKVKDKLEQLAQGLAQNVLAQSKLTSSKDELTEPLSETPRDQRNRQTSAHLTQEGRSGGFSPESNSLITRRDLDNVTNPTSQCHPFTTSDSPFRASPPEQSHEEEMCECDTARKEQAAIQTPDSGHRAPLFFEGTEVRDERVQGARLDTVPKAERVDQISTFVGVDLLQRIGVPLRDAEGDLLKFAVPVPEGGSAWASGTSMVPSRQVPETNERFCSSIGNQLGNMDVNHAVRLLQAYCRHYRVYKQTVSRLKDILLYLDKNYCRRGKAHPSVESSAGTALTKAAFGSQSPLRAPLVQAFLAVVQAYRRAISLPRAQNEMIQAFAPPVNPNKQPCPVHDLIPSMAGPGKTAVLAARAFVQSTQTLKASSVGGVSLYDGFIRPLLIESTEHYYQASAGALNSKSSSDTEDLFPRLQPDAYVALVNAIVEHEKRLIEALALQSCSSHLLRIARSHLLSPHVIEQRLFRVESSLDFDDVESNCLTRNGQQIDLSVALRSETNSTYVRTLHSLVLHVADLPESRNCISNLLRRAARAICQDMLRDNPLEQIAKTRKHINTVISSMPQSDHFQKVVNDAIRSASSDGRLLAQRLAEGLNHFLLAMMKPRAMEEARTLPTMTIGREDCAHLRTDSVEQPPPAAGEDPLTSLGNFLSETLRPLFRCLEDKDVFESIYRCGAIHRLLNLSTDCFTDEKVPVMNGLRCEVDMVEPSIPAGGSINSGEIDLALLVALDQAVIKFFSEECGPVYVNRLVSIVESIRNAYSFPMLEHMMDVADSGAVVAGRNRTGGHTGHHWEIMAVPGGPSSIATDGTASAVTGGTSSVATGGSFSVNHVLQLADRGEGRPHTGRPSTVAKRVEVLMLERVTILPSIILSTSYDGDARQMMDNGEIMRKVYDVPQMGSLAMAFLTHCYNREYVGRRLVWFGSYGQCIVRMYGSSSQGAHMESLRWNDTTEAGLDAVAPSQGFAAENDTGKWIDLKTSPYQAAMLLLSRDKRTVGTEHLQNAIGLGGCEHTFRGHLSGLLSSGIFMETDDGRLSVNVSFPTQVSPRTAFYPVPQMDHQKSYHRDPIGTNPPEELLSRRQIQLDAAIMRVAKRSGRISHHRLVTGVAAAVQPYFNPSNSVVRDQIESLINRDFLERDPNHPGYYLYRC